LKLKPVFLAKFFANGKAVWSKNLITSSLQLAKDQINFIILEFRKKPANIITQQKFLENCKVNKLIQKSFCFKDHLNTYDDTYHTKKVDLLNLNHVLKDKRFQWSQIVK
jgi:hypothetical protein